LDDEVDGFGDFEAELFAGLLVLGDLGEDSFDLLSL
jgi:hypothetical protein